MGCFDSTCAMTRLPIHHGDEIVYVEYKNIWSSKTRDDECSTYDFLQYTYHAYKTPDYQIENIKRSEARLALRYPNSDVNVEEFIETSLREELGRNRSKIVIVHGKYNDYGGIGERWEGETVYPDDNIRLSNLYFFVHKGVWDAYAGADDYETIYNINRAAYDARIELFCGNRPLGQQYSEGEFLEARKKIRDIEEQILPTLWCSHSDEELEDE